MVNQSVEVRPVDSDEPVSAHAFKPAAVDEPPNSAN